MDRAVLADLERREVEPVRRDLPAQLRDLAPGDALQAIVDERGLELGQLRVEVRGSVVVAGARSRVVGQRHAGPAQALGDEPEPLAIGLVREAAAELSVGLGKGLGVAGQAVREGSGDARRRRGRRDRLHQAHRHRLVPVEDVVRLDAQRPFGHLGRHGRVPVAVTADPRSEAQERRHAGRSSARPRTAGARGVQRGVGGAIQPWHEREQRRIEHGHRRAHLVERLGGHGAQVGGAPHERDLLAQPAADLAVLRRREARVVQPLEECRATAQRDERGPPAGLRRVRGQDRGDAQPAEDVVERRVVAPGPAQPRDRLGDRVVQDPVARRTLPAPKRPDAAAGLGEVHELEVQREGRDDRLHGTHVQPVELGLDASPELRVVAAPEVDGRTPESLDEVEDLLAGLLRDDLAEERAEEPDLERQGVARAGRSDARRLRASRARSRFPPARCRHDAASEGRSAGRVRNLARTRPQPFSAATVLTLVS